MSSKQKQAQKNGPTDFTASASIPGSIAAPPAHWTRLFSVHALLVFAVSFVLYGNTIGNEYALDDNIVILKNEFVYRGLEGLEGIFSKDAFYSYCKTTNTENMLAGGRYRPLSIATFAIEQQFLGPVSADAVDSVVAHAGDKGAQRDALIHAMHIRHFDNVLFFGLGLVALLGMLRMVVFRGSPMAALAATLLFACHPVHSEVVANVKSRDEICSLAFICLTFILACGTNRVRHKWAGFAGPICFLFALLSKEYGLALLILLPLAMVWFNGKTPLEALKGSMPFYAVAVLYALIRIKVVGFSAAEIDNDIWNNPYALATPLQKAATVIATPLNYLRLLFFPFPLSCDYSYNTIPYKTLGSPLVGLSVIYHAGLLVGIWATYKKQRAVAFGLAFYFLSLLMVNNWLINIGGTMGERLLYHASMGGIICMVALGNWCHEKYGPNLQKPIGAIVLILCLLCATATMARNTDWKNDLTLYEHDVKTVPNSLLVNANLGVAYVNAADDAKDSARKVQLLMQGVAYLDKALKLDSTCLPPLINRGLACFRMGNPDEAARSYDRILVLLPTYPQLPELDYNLGVYYYLHGQPAQAAARWHTVLRLNPNFLQARNALHAVGE